jgi:hypothetical protein
MGRENNGNFGLKKKITVILSGKKKEEIWVEIIYFTSVSLTTKIISES